MFIAPSFLLVFVAPSAAARTGIAAARLRSPATLLCRESAWPGEGVKGHVSLSPAQGKRQ
jgi:hypothetical protein